MAETYVVTPEVVESEGVAPEEDELIVVVLEVLSWKLFPRKRWAGSCFSGSGWVASCLSAMLNGELVWAITVMNNNSYIYWWSKFIVSCIVPIMLFFIYFQLTVLFWGQQLKKSAFVMHWFSLLTYCPLVMILGRGKYMLKVRTLTLQLSLIMSTFDLLSNNVTLVSGSLTEMNFCQLIGFTNIENVASFFLIQIWYKSSNFKGV